MRMLGCQVIALPNTEQIALKQYETLSSYTVSNNAMNRRREETYMSNYSDAQTSNTQ